MSDPTKDSSERKESMTKMDYSGLWNGTPAERAALIRRIEERRYRLLAEAGLTDTGYAST